MIQFDSDRLERARMAVAGFEGDRGTFAPLHAILTQRDVLRRVQKDITRALSVISFLLLGEPKSFDGTTDPAEGLELATRLFQDRPGPGSTLLDSVRLVLEDHGPSDEPATSLELLGARELFIGLLWAMLQPYRPDAASVTWADRTFMALAFALRPEVLRAAVHSGAPT